MSIVCFQIQVLLLNGTQTEGIFRVSADVDEVGYWKARLDRWDVPEHKSTMGEFQKIVNKTRNKRKKFSRENSEKKLFCARNFQKNNIFCHLH